jgi:hypothetical protein
MELSSMNQQADSSTPSSLTASNVNLPLLPCQPILALILVKDSNTDRVISWRTQEISTVAAYIDILQTLNSNTLKEK